MSDQRRPGTYPPELRERAVRLVRDHEHEYGSQWEAICSVAEKLGPTAETVRKWVRRDEIDNGARPGVTTAERERIRELEAGEPGAAPSERDPQSGLGFLRGGARPPTTK